MKQKTKELDVDFIGEQNQPLTREEQLEISVFIQTQKEGKRNKNNREVRKKEKQLA